MQKTPMAGKKDSKEAAPAKTEAAPEASQSKSSKKGQRK
jgi:hypothetical protein